MFQWMVSSSQVGSVQAFQSSRHNLPEALCFHETLNDRRDGSHRGGVKRDYASALGQWCQHLTRLINYPLHPLPRSDMIAGTSDTGCKVRVDRT
jgi:hypothetical protein